MEHQTTNSAVQTGQATSPAPEAGRDTAVVRERPRVAEIQAAGRAFELPVEMVSDAMRDGASVDAFNRSILQWQRENDGGLLAPGGAPETGAGSDRRGFRRWCRTIRARALTGTRSYSAISRSSSSPPGRRWT